MKKALYLLTIIILTSCSSSKTLNPLYTSIPSLERIPSINNVSKKSVPRQQKSELVIHLTQETSPNELGGHAVQGGTSRCGAAYPRPPRPQRVPAGIGARRLSWADLCQAGDVAAPGGLARRSQIKPVRGGG